MKIQKVMGNYIIMTLLLGIFYGSNSSYGAHIPGHLSTEGQEVDVLPRNGASVIPEPLSQLNNEQEEFKKTWDQLPSEAQSVILDTCGGNWSNQLQNLQTENEYIASLQKCGSEINSSYSSETMEAANLNRDLDPKFLSGDQWKEIFPKHQQHISQIFNGMTQYMSPVAQPQASSGRGRGPMTSGAGQTRVIVLREGLQVGFMREVAQDPFITERKDILAHYGCENQGISGCYSRVIKRYPEDIECLKKAGFKSCRPFLKNSGCNKDTVLALESELSQEDKAGMTYICWKAATQGAQCCMNPDQCPTDGAFRGIASQLQKAAPGMVQAFAGLEAIKGDYQKACEANLLANAAGPLGSLKTKTCGDSVSVCEETCDKAVQNFKERFKQAVMGQQQRRGTGQEENPTTIDDIVNAAKAIEENDLNIAKEDVDTCSKAVVYLDNLFKDKEKNKKIKSLNEKLSHASLVDCSGEVFKHSGGSSAGGASPGIPGINPMAAQMCRQGNPAGPQAPRFPVVGPTPNPRTNQAFLTGGKTIAPGGDFVAPGVPGAPGDEFIEPDRGPAGANALQGGWTNTGGSGMGPGGGGPGGGGLTGSPSRDEGGGNGGAGDNLPMAYPEGFDMGGGGFNGGGGDLSSEDEERLRMAKYMEKRDREEERKKEEERLREIDAQGSIFSRISRTIQEWCEKENCSEE